MYNWRIIFLFLNTISFRLSSKLSYSNILKFVFGFEKGPGWPKACLSVLWNPLMYISHLYWCWGTSHEYWIKPSLQYLDKCHTGLSKSIRSNLRKTWSSVLNLIPSIFDVCVHVWTKFFVWATCNLVHICSKHEIEGETKIYRKRFALRSQLLDKTNVHLLAWRHLKV